MNWIRSWYSTQPPPDRVEHTPDLPDPEIGSFQGNHQDHIDTMIRLLRPEREFTEGVLSYFLSTFVGVSVTSNEHGVFVPSVSGDKIVKKVRLLLAQITPRIGSTNGVLQNVYHLLHLTQIMVRMNMCPGAESVFLALSQHYEISGEFCLFAHPTPENSFKILQDLVEIYPEYVKLAVPAAVNFPEVPSFVSDVIQAQIPYQIEAVLANLPEDRAVSKEKSDREIELLSKLHPGFWSWRWFRLELEASHERCSEMIDDCYRAGLEHDTFGYPLAPDLRLLERVFDPVLVDTLGYVDLLPDFVITYSKYFSDPEVLRVLDRYLNSSEPLVITASVVAAKVFSGRTFTLPENTHRNLLSLTLSPG